MQNGAYLVVVSLAVRQALPLVVPMAEKRLLTLGADEMLSTDNQRKNSVLGEGEKEPRHPGSFSRGGNKIIMQYFGGL